MRKISREAVSDERAVESVSAAWTCGLVGIAVNQVAAKRNLCTAAAGGDFRQ
jgi:hypothetical protein